jgi:hypothetical protein
MHTQLGILILAANTGIMLFFTVAVAPTIFTVLPQEWAAKYVRAFFPKYYAVLGVTTAIAALLIDTTIFRLALAGCAFFFFFSQLWITPTVNRARDAGRERTFKILHTLSVVINLLQLVIFIWILYAGVRSS